MANYDKQVILETLRSIEYIWVGCAIKDGWFGSVIGWNIFASSLLRKRFTMERLKEEIEEYHLPLVIEDEKEMTNAFRVYIKKAA